MPTKPPLVKKPGKSSPNELAKDAIAREEAVNGDRVRPRLRIVLPRALAEALTAEAIRHEFSLERLATEILEVAASKLPK